MQKTIASAFLSAFQGPFDAANFQAQQTTQRPAFSSTKQSTIPTAIKAALCATQLASIYATKPTTYHPADPAAHLSSYPSFWSAF